MIERSRVDLLEIAKTSICQYIPLTTYTYLECPVEQVRGMTIDQSRTASKEFDVLYKLTADNGESIASLGVT